jgi:hypothetical protein
MLQIRYFKVESGRESIVTCERDDAGRETFFERDLGKGGPGRPFAPTSEEREIAAQCLEVATGAVDPCGRITYEGRDDLTIDWIR